MIVLKKTGILYLSILILLTFSCDNYDIPDQSTSFIKYYGSRLNDYGCDAIQKADGGFIIAGVLSVPDSGTNICLIFTDKSGNSEHITSFGGAYNDIVSRMLILPDSGIVTIGSTQKNPSGNKDIYVARTNKKGEIQWTKQYGSGNNDEGMGIMLENNTNLVMVGYTEKTGTVTDKDIWMFKIDINGNEVWPNQRIRNYPGDNIGMDIVPLNGGYLVMSTTIGAFEQYVNPELNSVFIYRTDEQGISTTSFTFISGNGHGSHFGTVIKADPSGYFYILGTAKNDLGNSDILLARFNLSLALDTGWPKYLNVNGSVSGNSLIVSGENLHIFGTNVTPSGSGLMILYIANKNGNISQHRQYNLLDGLEGLGFSITSDGGYIMTGGSRIAEDDKSEIVIVKTKAGGLF